jgi:hypothetical protein
VDPWGSAFAGAGGGEVSSGRVGGRTGAAPPPSSAAQGPVWPW